jgi:hypothetical protein
MNDTLLQGLIWLGAFGVLFTFLRRRRTRRAQQ